MLTGRESLLRLIGKRRRSLPSRHNLLSTPTPNSLNLDVNDSGNLISPIRDNIRSPETPTSPGNSDDLCLSRKNKKKRRLTQTTLLQWSGSKQSEDSPFIHPQKQQQQQQSILEFDDDSSSEEISKTVALDEANGDEAIQTFIVGRKFSDIQDLEVGAKICLLRHPENIKDPNAIKVLSSDSGLSEMLGYLPKDVSQCLSPLIDQYGLKFEGTITCVPKNSSEAVPVKVVCHKMTSDGWKESESAGGDFKLLWEKVLQVVEHQMQFPPKTTRYQLNFNVLVQEVLRSCSHLFTADEKTFLESFPSLSEDSQRLFIRLYTRKGPWFRLSNISYPEVSDSLQALKDLTVSGFMSSVEDANDLSYQKMKEITELLNVTELRDILSVNKVFSRGSRKRDLIDSLCSYYNDRTRMDIGTMILERTGLCAKISSTAESLIWRVERLFFLNGEQDLSSFVLLDLGIIKYPTYKCIDSDQIFSDRAKLLAYEEAIEVAQLMDESLDSEDSGTVLKCIMIAETRISSSSSSESALFNCFTAPWVYSKMVLLGVSFLENQKRYNQAVYLLRRLLSCFNCDGRRGYWTVRLSTDLEHMGRPNESLSVAEQGLLDPWVRAGSRIALQRRVLRLAKPPRRWKTPTFPNLIDNKIPEVTIQGRSLNCEVGMKNRFYGEDGEQCGVEQLALQYYNGGGGWQGMHTESSIWLTIFGLLMWDILFSDVPGVFQTRFQTAPLDLDTESFYLTRKETIESQLEKVANGMAEEILIISYETHRGTACRGVVWERFSLEELRAAVACVGGKCVASLCRYLAQDYRSWCSGMPDLLLWRFKENGYEGEAKLVEVKSEKDRLSEQQRAWLLLLMDSGFNVEICKVRPACV
ncbi:PREDICTED: fanconi-associated nuclease 1 homolog isoform X1 [Brassica oleracea var. oleracea]|uniref:Fanconi-associated nuclease n=1 Tax=Brassica oleracea var. oleracea TaxID=109376 RepID=A0A0D3DJR4_BRAOL|nr:PREDICTED: fanconi-associated nuclease 1 homolog isoform X1 [Brassica oleracea var. oleracea]